MRNLSLDLALTSKNWTLISSDNVENVEYWRMVNSTDSSDLDLNPSITTCWLCDIGQVTDLCYAYVLTYK